MSGQYAQSWLDWEAIAGGRSVLTGSVQEMRAMFTAMVQALLPLQGPFSSNVDVKDGEVEGVKYRIYTPKGAAGPLPTAIWNHAGGYVLGNLDSEHVTCGVVAEQTQSVVISIDYTLAPEAVWPTQLEECLKVYKWAHANASSFGGDPNKFYTAGVSAGGGLAFQIANQILRDPALKSSLKGVCALVPITAHPDSIPAKYADKYTAYKDNASGVPMIDRKSMDIFYDAVKVSPTDSSVFTILASDIHASFPPTYLASCEFDPLRDDAYVMEEALKEAGAKTKHDHYPGFPHAFAVIPTIPESKTFMENTVAGIKWLQGQM